MLLKPNEDSHTEEEREEQGDDDYIDGTTSTSGNDNDNNNNSNKKSDKKRVDFTKDGRKKVKQYDEDALVTSKGGEEEIEIEEKDTETFGTREKKSSKGFTETSSNSNGSDSGNKSSGNVQQDDAGEGDDDNDEFDDPSSKKNTLKDNLSDAEAKNLCLEWKKMHNIEPGVSWGSMPFNLQQKWQQYSCDYLLTRDNK